MNKKYIVIIIATSIICALFFTQKNLSPTEIIVDFYDLNFLRNSTAVEKTLKSVGFFETNFKTKDNLNINTIMLDQNKTHNVIATIISFPGFVPGNKEGMSTLYAMLKEQPYNFMFIDSRGHGKSDGELLTLQAIKNYGQSQYLDMVGAIQHITQYNKENNINSSIIIHGLCSGAYHTIKAVVHIKKDHPEIYHQIKGIVLDSAWSSIPEIAQTVITAESISRCKNYSMLFFQPYLAWVLQILYNNCFKQAHHQQTPIVDIIADIDQPILFIHAQDDQFVPVSNACQLIAKAKNATYWFVPNSSHVNNHIDYKDAYREKLQHFIITAL